MLGCGAGGIRDWIGTMLVVRTGKTERWAKDVVKGPQCHVNRIKFCKMPCDWSRGCSTKFGKSFIFLFSVVFSFHGYLVLIDLNCFKETTKLHTKILFSVNYGYIYSLNSL